MSSVPNGEENENSVSESTEKPYVLFFGEDPPFSNWYPSTFLVENVEYNCVEQFMMSKKAELFQDFETMEKIT